ncbi:muts domain V-domain-containing protein [Gilbertella persicaria]|uniref:muts domain V-domain-containing protein n=1 Tax=Gilbertella persicaria TaxID=101096 RepID=UPI00221F27F4|nr:muts domain V-domain-containing protein [Gilbertella persicaria]KAI8073459.1 muts domain V-domain-containing protein [Gilbertella persicaria]
MAPAKKTPPQQQSSLLSFFNKQSSSSQPKPKQEEIAQSKPPDSTEEDTMEVETTPQSRKNKRISYKESDDSDIEDKIQSPAPGKKRRLVRRISDESDEEFVPAKSTDMDQEELEDIFSHDIEEDDMMVEPETPKRAAVTPLMERFKKVSVYEKPSVSLMSRLNATSKAEKKQERTQKFKEKNDERYHWLQDQKDLQGNRPGSPDYDPRTLYIPPSAWQKFTPFEKQYWEVKHKHWDTIVFFKKGKFYELYEKDADIGHKDFDLKMTDRVNMRMVGVPEMSFDYWTAQFIAKGHKVAKVDQMETAIGKSMREKSGNKADKVIRRELTSVLTAGTLVDAGLLTNELSTYCMSIKEYCADEAVPPQFGICFVDTSTAQFNLVHFEDDIQRTKLETLIMQIKPRELVTEKGRLSKMTTRLLKSILNDPLWNMLIPEQEFWDARVTEDELNFSAYFDEKDSPQGLVEAMKEARQNPLLMSAFGALIWYLRSLKLDRELLSAKNMVPYDPIQNATSLVLDGQTLANLEIFQNSYDGSTEGTVFKLLANSITPFGKRLFKQWLCHPLRNIHDINQRLDAIEDAMNLSLHDRVSKPLASLPDLERLISRIHSGRVKVKEFLSTLQGFEVTQEIVDGLRDDRSRFKSSLLIQLMDKFPQIQESLEQLKRLFVIADVDVDYQKTKTIVPTKGTNQDWDDLEQHIADIQQQFADHLTVVKRQLKCARIEYKDLGKDIYQIEVPKGVSVPKDWIQLSTTSKATRYWDSTVKGLVTTYKELLETKNEFVKKFALQVYRTFDASYATWLSAVQIIAHLDGLLGLAKGSMQMGEPVCRPVFVEQESSLIEFKDLRHPCVIPGVATDFIPNDVGLGGDESSVIVLTGPNMGGKSTLLRQTCVAIILAQLGGYVPASSCRMTPCDRIYTRIGANDNIMGGQSTFMVELAETSKILKEATPRSMVILDELGRGTSTFDGYAIAYGVLHYLATHVGCLGMFATHYQTLCKEFERSPEIKNMHM